MGECQVKYLGAVDGGTKGRERGAGGAKRRSAGDGMWVVGGAVSPAPPQYASLGLCPR